MGEITLKLLTIGDASVGKTCIMLRFAEDDFPMNTMPTIGVEYKTKRVTLDNKQLKLQVWDTAGQERYHKTLSSTFYRRAHGIVLVFDLSDRHSFDHVKNWMHQIQQKADKNVSIALVGNKSDLTRKVELSEAEALARSYNLPFFSTSARTGDNVAFMFESLAEECLRSNAHLLEHGNCFNQGFRIPDKALEEKTGRCC